MREERIARRWRQRVALADQISALEQDEPRLAKNGKERWVPARQESSPGRYPPKEQRSVSEVQKLEQANKDSEPAAADGASCTET